MHPFVTALRKGLFRFRLNGQRVLLAVSGGADSVALLRGLVELTDELSLNLHVAHLNHRLRDADSDRDASFVKDLSARLNVPAEIGELSPTSFSSSPDGVEETARHLRYRFLETTAEKWHCPNIALAHTADDQSETVLHHLLRGTGIAGLRGIPAERTLGSGCCLIRPLLSIRRSLIETYLQDCGQQFCTDHTNADTAMTRNKLRHVVLPMLRDQVNPQLDSALSRLAEQAGEIEEILSSEAEQLLTECLKEQQPDVCYLDVRGLANQPAYLVREMFRLLWRRQNWPQQAMGYEQWNRLADVVTSRKTITLPDRIEARYHAESLLVLRRNPS